MTHFRKMYIAAEIVNNHVIPNTNTMYYSEGEAESYLIKELRKDGTKVFLIIPHCAMHFGEESDYLEMKERITKKYDLQSDVQVAHRLSMHSLNAILKKEQE